MTLLGPKGHQIGAPMVTDLVTLSPLRGHQIGESMVTDLVTLPHPGGTKMVLPLNLRGHHFGDPLLPRGAPKWCSHDAGRGVATLLLDAVVLRAAMGWQGG